MGLSSGGMISGLDTKTLIAQLMAIERRPLLVIENKKSAQQQLLTLYGDASTKLNAIQAAAQALDAHSDFRKITGTSGDEDIFTVTAGSSATPGSHSLKVLSLAQAEMEVSQGYSSKSDGVGTGDFSITVGTEETVINITTSNNTLEGLRDAINNSDAEVTASIINDGDADNPYRLVITSNETGTANAITIDASGLTGGTTPAFTDGSVEGEPGQQAVDASLVLDGVSITKSSNVIDDMIEGVTVTLKDVDADTAYSLTLESNTEEITSSIQTLVDAYNDFHNWLDTKKGTDALKYDTMLESMDRELRSLISSGPQGLDAEDYRSQTQAGMSFTRNGALQFDTEDFTEALEDDFNGVMRLFSAYADPSSAYISFNTIGDSTQAGTYSVSITGVGASFAAQINGHDATTYSGSFFTGAEGEDEEGLSLRFLGDTIGDYGTVHVSLGIMELIDRKIEAYTDGVDGTIKNREEAINLRIRDLDRQIERKERSLDKTEARYNAQFTRLEMLLAQLQSQSSYLTSMSYF